MRDRLGYRRMHQSAGVLKDSPYVSEENPADVASPNDAHGKPNDADDEVEAHGPPLHRKLKSRHLQMIAIGGLSLCSHQRSGLTIGRYYWSWAACGLRECFASGWPSRDPDQLFSRWDYCLFCNVGLKESNRVFGA